MGEWLKPAVLKTAVRGTVPGVRIPLPPLLYFIDNKLDISRCFQL